VGGTVFCCAIRAALKLVAYVSRGDEEQLTRKTVGCCVSRRLVRRRDRDLEGSKKSREALGDAMSVCWDSGKFWSSPAFWPAEYAMVCPTRATSQFKLVQDINYPLRVIRGGGAGGAKEEAH